MFIKYINSNLSKKIKMKRVILKISFLIGAYILMAYLFPILLSNILVNYEGIENVKEFYFDFIDTFIYIVLIGITIFIKKKEIGWLKSPNIKRLNVVLIIILVLSFGLLEDLLLRFDVIVANTSGSEMITKNGKNNIELLLIFFNMVILIPIYEELTFRFTIFNYFINNRIVIGYFFSSLLFALINMNLYSFNGVALISAFIFGLVANLLYLKIGLWSSLLFHFLYNLLWFSIQNYKELYWDYFLDFEYDSKYWLLLAFSFTIFGVLIIYLLVINPVKSYAIEGKSKMFFTFKKKRNKERL